MHGKIVLFYFVTILAFNLSGQSVNDTANTPYWIEMMQDKSINFYRTQSAFNLYWQNRPIQKGSGWKAFKRWEWISMKTMDSLGNFPDDGIQQQLHDDRIRMDDMYWDAVRPGLGAGTVACKTQGDWKPIGPTTLPVNNTGQMNGMGRVNAIALHPTDTNTYFVGSAAGGIWKTTNNGLTWSVNTDSLPTLGVSAIAITKGNPSIMYFGSGDRDNSDAAGYGVFKSTNGGSTWAISNTGMGNRTVGKLAIDPNNASVLIAACNGGLYRSTNAGSSWTQVVSGGFFKDVIFKPNNSKVIYATTGGFFYRSLDNGATWSNITSGLPTTSVSRAVIDVNPLDNSLVYFWIANGSVNKGVYLSRDSGTTFRTQSTTPNLHDYSTNGSGTGGQAWYDMDMVTDPTNAGIIYVGGVNIFKSGDTGKTWTIAGYWVNQIHADQHELVSCPISKRIFAGNDGGLYFSRTKGTPWVQVKSGLGIAQIYKMDASRTQKDILINGWQDNGTGNYNNGWYTTYGGDGMDCEIDQTDNRYSYGELYYGSVFRLLNVSAQATIATSGYIAPGSDTINESGDWVTPITLREGSGTTMYIGYKNLWRSNNIRNSTVTWKKISNNLGGSNSFNFTEIENSIGNTDILYASRSNGTFYRSDNVNATTPTWTAITQPVAGVIQAIETDPKNPGVVYIGIGPYVYRSRNKGSTWTQVATTHTYNVGSILLDTSSKQKGLYVGTIGGGVWYTDTTLSAWRYFSKGLPNTVRVTDLEMYYEPTAKCNCNVLYGSTYNRGTWFSTIYNDGTKKPVAMLEPYDSIICSSASISFKDKSCFNPARFKWEFSPYTISYINGSDTFSPDASVSFNAKGTYAFKFMAENCIGIDTFRGTIIVSDTLKVACKPGTNTFNVGGLGIFKVDMAGFTRSSSGRNPEGSFIDLSCSRVIKVTKGKTYALKVTTGASNNEQVKAYIDYNNNGSLTDAGELVYQPSAGLLNHLDSISIPSTATVGKILRLRIRSDFNSIGTNPCNTLSYGQTEDYGLWIESGILIPKYVVNKSTACQNTTVKVTDSTVGSGASYSWNFGSGASPGTASGKGPYNVTYSSAGYKTITLVVDGKTYKKDSAVLVYAAPNISISFTKGDSSICEKLAISMKVNDANSSGSSFQWRYNGSNVTDSTLGFFRFSNAGLSRSGAYSVMAFTAQCRDTAFQNVYIRPVPVPKFNINDSDQCLTGNSFTFTNATTIASGTYKNYWYPGDGSVDSTTSKTRTYSTYNTFNVKLRSVSTFGCKDSITKQVKVYENAAPQYSTNKSAQCFRGHSFTHTNTTTLNAGTYASTWHFGDGSKDFTKNPPAKTYSAFAPNYKVRLVVATNNGCKDSIEKTMTLNPNPVPGFSVNDTDQCLTGNSFVYTSSTNISSGTFKNFWYPGDGSIDSSSTSKTKTYSAYGSFSVKLRSVSNNGCKDSITKLVQVYENAAPQFGISNTTQCFKGNSFTYTNTTSLNTGTYTNAWSFGDGTKDLNKNPSAKSYSVFNPAYKVKLVVTTNRGCRDSIEKTININPNPVASFSINDSGQCQKGNNFAFTNSGSISSGTFTSSWNFDDGGNSAQTSPSHAFASASTYKVKLKLSSNNLCTDSLTRTVIVFHDPKAGFNVTDSTQCLKGNTFDFVSAGTIPSGNFTTRYTFGDGTFSTVPTLSKAYIKDSTFTVMMLTVSNNGCRDSITRKMYVYPHSIPGFSINARTQCFANNTYQFNNQSTLKSGTYTSLWRLGDGTQSISNTQVNKKYFSYVDSAKVTIVVTTSFNCVDSASKYIVLLSSPKPDFIINDSAQCLLDNAFSFTNTSSINKGMISSAWSFGDGNTAATGNSAHTYAVHNTAYTVKLVTTANAVCKDSISRTVIVFPMPKASFSINDSAQCFKANIFAFTENGSIPYGSYNNSWDMGDANQLTGSSLNHTYASTGQYQVRLVSSSGQACNDTMTKAVIVFHSPKAGFSINDTVQCVNINSFTFADQTVSAATYGRKWFAIPMLITGTGSSVNHVFADTGFQTVKLFVSTSDLCTDSIMKKVYLAPTSVFAVNGGRKVCLNDDISLTAVSVSKLNYEWSMDGGPVFSGNPFLHTTVAAGTRNFTVKGINSYGCENQVSLPSRVIVYDLPVADIDTNVLVTVKGIDIEFMDVSAAAVSSRQWQFSNGGSGTGQTEIVSLGDSGSVIAMLTVTDTNGCKGSVQRKYFFTISNSYYMPNIFTPNGDGHNDSFRMSGFVKLRKFSIKIFNRWGEMVFATEDPTQGWDGRSGGEFVIDGNYLYFLELEDLNGQLFQKKGMLTVLR
jgi:gliding motility-associated-like protein